LSQTCAPPSPAQIGDAGAVALADCLLRNRALTVLNLRANLIGDDGAANLAAALMSNGSLTSLCLWSNAIGDAGAALLAGSLKQVGR
jgi:hypothetical protein